MRGAGAGSRPRWRTAAGRAAACYWDARSKKAARSRGRRWRGGDWWATGEHLSMADRRSLLLPRRHALLLPRSHATRSRRCCRASGLGRHEHAGSTMPIVPARHGDACIVLCVGRQAGTATATARHGTTTRPSCVHYRKPDVCRVPDALPRAVSRALGKGTVCRVRTKKHSANT